MKRVDLFPEDKYLARYLLDTRIDEPMAMPRDWKWLVAELNDCYDLDCRMGRRAKELNLKA